MTKNKKIQYPEFLRALLDKTKILVRSRLSFLAV